MTSNIAGSVDFFVRAMGALQVQKAACAAPAWAQRRVLDDLLGQSRGTAFGHDHSLRYAKTMTDWRDAIPVRSYSGFNDYIDRIADGEPKVLTRSNPYGFLKTSGTSGSPKYIPTTSHWRYHYRGPALYAQWGLYFHLLGLSEVGPNSAFDLSWERSPHLSNQMHGHLPVFSITQRHESLGGADWTPPWYGSSWFRASTTSTEDTLYLKVRHLVGTGVRLLVSVNPSKIVFLAELVERRAEELIRDVRDGTCQGAAHPVFQPDPHLARSMEYWSRADGRLRIDHLFPQLSLVVCWTSGAARLYEPWLSSLIPNVPVIPFSTTGTEGIVTLPIDGHVSSGALAVNQGLYEFAEVTDPSETSLGAIVEFADLEIGGMYRLIMSQANGLYRYDTNDVYVVTGWSGDTPRIQFLSRAGNASSFTGEKLTEEDIYIAMNRVLNDLGWAASMYAVAPVWDQPPGYVVAIESAVDVDDFDAPRFSQLIDKALQDVNIEYGEKRATGRLSRADVICLRPGAFRRQMLARTVQGVPSAQVKHQWLHRDDAILDELTAADEVLGPRQPHRRRADPHHEHVSLDRTVMS